MTYKPKPINIGRIDLPAELEALTEKLAEHVHDLWASKRLAEGWKYGPKRDDNTLETPNLVPYYNLPEKEKEYDRETALGTIKAIIALGYRIEKAQQD